MSGTTPVASLPYATLTDTADANALSQNLATALDHLVVPKYANVSARTSANGSPTAGDQCWVTSTAELYVYNGTAWTSSKPRTKWKTAGTSRNSTTTKADDPDLTISVEANSTYTFKVYPIWTTAAAAPGWQWSFSMPAGAQAAYSALEISTTAATFNSATMNTIGSALSASITTGSGGDALASTSSQLTAGLLVTSATSGTFAFSWAQHVSNASATTLGAGSYLEIWKVA